MEYKKILVPVSGSPADEAAMRLACRLARKDKGKIWAVTVVAVKRALPLDAEIDSEIQHSEGVLDKIEAIAEDEDYEVETDILQARDAGPAIVDEALEGGRPYPDGFFV